MPCTEVKLMDTDDYTAADVYPTSKEEFEKQYTWKVCVLLGFRE